MDGKLCLISLRQKSASLKSVESRYEQMRRNQGAVPPYGRNDGSENPILTENE
jgi:hypothetical protein